MFRFVRAQAKHVDETRADCYVAGKPFRTSELMAERNGAIGAYALIDGVSEDYTQEHQDCFYPEVVDDE